MHHLLIPKVVKVTAFGIVAAIAVRRFTRDDGRKFFTGLGNDLVGFILRWKMPNSRWARFFSVANKNIVVMGVADQNGRVVRQETVLADDLDSFLEHRLPANGEPLPYKALLAE
jgi:hypothetical protein